MKRILVAAVLCGAVLGGCQQTSKEAQNAIGLYRVGDYAGAEAIMRPTIGKKDENYVLNNCRYGSAALAAGDLAGAENSFMAAYQVMNSTHVNDSGRTAGATVVFEGVKVWTGEPFERA